jgi:hypothetical protein
VSDYFSKFEAELRRAARRAIASERQRRFGWRPRTLLVGIALIAVSVPAVAAVTGAFDDTRAPQHLAPGSVASLAPPCKGAGPSPLPPAAKGPAPPELVRLVGILRRPQTASDRLPAASVPRVSGLMADAVRLAMTGADGTKYYVVPAANINYSPPVPDTPECAAYRRNQRAAQAGVCVWQVGGTSSGGTCASIKQLRERRGTGPTQGYSQGMAAGTMSVVGVVADGVRAVVLRYPARAAVRRVRIPVHGNVYAAVIRGRPELGPSVYAETARGVALIQRGPEPASRRQRELNRRSAERDRTATGKPTVIPAVGYPHTTFTFRVRVKPLRGYVYVARASGPPGPCRDALKPVAIAPKRSGSLRGLIKLGIGYGPLGLHRMCLGHYRGTITRVRAGLPISQGKVVKRFAFAVRRRT